jgi:hypothetical protein
VVAQPSPPPATGSIAAPTCTLAPAEVNDRASSEAKRTSRRASRAKVRA